MAIMVILQKKKKKMDRKIDYRNILKINCKLINSFDDAMGLRWV